MTRPLLRNLYAALAAALLVTAAVLVGRHIQHSRHTLFVKWPPVLAVWDPHVDPGTPAALVVAAAGVVYGPVLAARLPWRALLVTAWATATAWIASLALIDGWQRGIAGRLTARHEYLQVIDRFDNIPAALRDFTHHILVESPDNWPAHVAGHPPAAPLTFVLLDRVGLWGGGSAGVWCIAVGATACVAVLVAVRVLAGESLARREAPFLVLAPAAVWMGASADAYFAAVAAWAVALLALAIRGRSSWWAAAAGLLFGLTCYLSYGLTLVALIGAAVSLLGRRSVRERPVLLAALVAGPRRFDDHRRRGPSSRSPADTPGGPAAPTAGRPPPDPASLRSAAASRLQNRPVLGIRRAKLLPHLGIDPLRRPPLARPRSSIQRSAYVSNPTAPASGSRLTLRSMSALTRLSQP
ncbi:hypothetical protein OG331_05650 [Streptomyces sp. NBC_01017]|uniref:hypothetical protein n=1 Tax=Streptomyces sp. NBC_01017 TaxID=2903721 RepID=UPI00386CE347|nr:hypothetical protein OG331_05650 [Streptomyces sp. NBC_01017]